MHLQNLLKGLDVGSDSQAGVIQAVDLIFDTCLSVQVRRVTSSDALVPSSFLLLLVRHLLLVAMHLFLVASCYY